LLNEKIDDTTATLDAQNARHQVFLQAADVVATLAIREDAIYTEAIHDGFLTVTILHPARRECVSLLIQLNIHRILLDSIKTLVSSIQAEADTPEHHSTSSSALYQRLLHAVRALKSLYVAVVNLEDPFGAQAAMSELVLSSAHARAQAMGLAIPSAHRSPSKFKSSNSLLGVSTTTQPRSPVGNPSLSQFADQIFLVGPIPDATLQAIILTHLSYTGRRSVYHTTATAPAMSRAIDELRRHRFTSSLKYRCSTYLNPPM
jgi:hypothetical protein